MKGRCSLYTFLRPAIGVPKLYAPFWNSNISIIEKVCVSNFFHSFQVIPMKLAASNPHEESMFSTYFVWGLTQRFQSFAPFFKTLVCAYREGVTIFFHCFQVISMIFFMFWHPNQFFKTVICNLQQVFELFRNELWVFQNSLNPGASDGLRSPGPLTKALSWTHRVHCSPPGPQHHFQVFNFWQLSPLNSCKNHFTICVIVKFYWPVKCILIIRSYYTPYYSSKRFRKCS